MYKKRSIAVFILPTVIVYSLIVVIPIFVTAYLGAFQMERCWGYELLWNLKLYKDHSHRSSFQTIGNKFTDIGWGFYFSAAADCIYHCADSFKRR